MVRFTKLTSCGDLSDCYVVFKCLATVERTAEYIDGTDISPVNMDGSACWVYETPPELKWERATITLNSIPVRIAEMIAGAPLYLNEDGDAVGYDYTRDMILNSNFAIELWMRQAGEVCADGVPAYDYYVGPWYTQGKVGQSSVGNANTTLVIEDARSGVTSPWGVGPYNVERNSTTDVPRAMLTPIDVATPGQETLSRFLVTTLAPPFLTGSECQDPTPIAAVAPTVGAAAVARVLTFPLRVDTGTPDLPGLIDWDDLTPLQAVSVGTTANHTYAAPGTYNVRYIPTGQSGPTYVSVDITVS